MDKIIKNKKVVELDTSLPLSGKICLDKFLFMSDSLNLKTVERKGKTSKIFNISRMRQDSEKFRFDLLYLEFKDLKPYLLKNICFNSLNCK